MIHKLAEPPIAWTTHTATMRRVLHVINGEHYSGAERVQDLLAAHLPEFGYEVGFACVKPGNFDKHRKYRNAPLIDAPMRFKFDWSAARRVRQFAKEGAYQAIHAHTPRSLFIADLVAQRLDVPLYYHVHSPVGRDSTRFWSNRINTWCERWCLRRATRIFCVSNSLRDYMIQLGLPETRIDVIPNAVPTMPRTTIQPPTEGTWKIGMIGLFRPRKGLEVLLQALASLKQRNCPVQVIAVGTFESSRYQQQIEHLVHQLHVHDMITWTGFETDVARRLYEMHAMVLPSLFGEGLPMVVLEAMAQGVPVVASRVEGIPEAIRDGIDGLIFEPGDPSGLADQLVRLTRDPELWRRLSESCWHRQRTHFSARSQAHLLSTLYQKGTSIFSPQ